MSPQLDGDDGGTRTTGGDDLDVLRVEFGETSMLSKPIEDVELASTSPPPAEFQSVEDVE